MTRSTWSSRVSTTPGAVETLVIDKDVPGAGHRVHLMATTSQFQAHREIGFGWAAGKDSFPEFELRKTTTRWRSCPQRQA